MSFDRAAFREQEQRHDRPKAQARRFAKANSGSAVKVPPVSRPDCQRPVLTRAAVFIFVAATSAIGAPFIPQSDNQVLERLPFAPTDPPCASFGPCGSGSKTNRKICRSRCASRGPIWSLGGSPAIHAIRAMLRPRSPLGGTSRSRLSKSFYRAQPCASGCISSMPLWLTSMPFSAPTRACSGASHAGNGAAGARRLRRREGRMPNSQEHGAGIGVDHVPSVGRVSALCEL